MNDRFEELAEQWATHCESVRGSSNPGDYLASPAFEAIVQLGPAAVPLILRRYAEERPGSIFWGAALARITGRADRGDGLSGNLERTRDAWLADLAARE